MKPRRSQRGSGGDDSGEEEVAPRTTRQSLRSSSLTRRAAPRRSKSSKTETSDSPDTKLTVESSAELQVQQQLERDIPIETSTNGNRDNLFTANAISSNKTKKTKTSGPNKAVRRTRSSAPSKNGDAVDKQQRHNNLASESEREDDSVASSKQQDENKNKPSPKPDAKSAEILEMSLVNEEANDNSTSSGEGGPSSGGGGAKEPEPAKPLEKPPHPLPASQTTTAATTAAIATTNGNGNHENGENGESLAQSRPKRHHPHSDEKKKGRQYNLDEDTLQAVKTYLQEHVNGDQILDEVEMGNFMLRMDRLATEQTRYQQKLVGHADSSDDDDDSLYGEILAEEEEHALGQAFFKSMASKVKKRHEKEFDLDKTTLDWIRRAAGLQKNNPLVHSHTSRQYGSTLLTEQEQQPTATGVVATRRSARRYTRGMARTSRTQKRKKDLSYLTGAIDDMEKEFGKFERKKRPAKPPPQPRLQRQVSSPHQADGGGEDDEKTSPIRLSGNKRKHKGLVAWYPKKARRGINDVGSRGEIIISSVLVDGVHVEAGTNTDAWEVFKKKLKKERAREYKIMKSRGLGQEYKEARRKEKESIHYVRKPVKAPPSLSLADWQRRKSLPNYGRDAPEETKREYRNRLKRQMPETYTKAGIIHRPKSWKLANPALSEASYHTPFEPPRVRHTDEVYASNCHKIVAALQGSARSWAVCEFFYSDLDKAWYNRCPFTEDAAKLGVRPGMKLTRLEWKAVRRLIPNKPRRFSQRFVSSQLNERNKYRNTVRMLQRNVGLALSMHFPYDVLAPIKVGSTVTAYSRKYRVIHRGVVLAHDGVTGRYVVQFERKEFGHDFCPDSEVSTHGVPEILIRAPETSLTAPLNTDSNSLPCTSSYGPIPGVQKKRDVVTSEKLTKLFPFNPHERNRSQSAAKKRERESDPTLEKAAETETFVSLLSSVEMATTRKSMLLQTIEKFNALMVQSLPFGDDAATAPGMSPQEEQHYAWLLANLERTNRFLDKALASFRTMYGDIYLPTTSVRGNEGNFMDKAVGEILAKRDELPPMALPWIVQLVVDAEGLGETIVTCLEQQKRSEKKRGEKLQIETDRTRLMRKRLASFGELLLTASYCDGARKGPLTTNNLTIATALATGADKLFSSDLPADSPNGPDLFAETLASRELAAADLQEAIDLLNAELAASSVQQTLEN